jgi:hypothetical protein
MPARESSRPRFADGERQFWRIVNASPDLYADLQIDGEQLEIAALPLASYTSRSMAPFQPALRATTQTRKGAA